MSPCIRRLLGAVIAAVEPGRELDDDDDVEPDNSIEAAAEVVEAIAVAETGSGWLWVPS